MPTTSYAHAPATLPLYLRAALPAIPGIGGLPGIKHVGRDVPDLTLRREGVATDVDHLAAYADVCGFSLRDTVPVTYPHMAAFGLQMAMMVDTSFPFAPMGLVHLRNTIVQHRPMGVRERYDVEVRAADLREHPKGRLIDLLSTVSVGDEVVWEETMTLLRRGGGGADEATPAPLSDVAAPTGVARWRLGGDLGRRYASVSGDRNPIHLSPVTAKAFGFPRQIAHGMWTKARAVAAVEQRLGESCRVDAEFRKPVLLPASVTFGTREDADGLVLGVTGPAKDTTPGREHLVARVRAA